VAAPKEPEALSPRERRVLRHLVRGFSLAEIVDSSGVSAAKIDRIRSVICKKLHLYRHAVVRKYAAEVGLLNRIGDRRVR
jgi:DNA-binding NarL/FixJ family response regulator